MRTIWKYELELEHEQSIEIPAPAQPLSVQVQSKAVQLWALVNPDAPSVRHIVRIVATGQPIHGHLGEYVGTIQLDGGTLVFHVFIDRH
jgi:hypothetical protein